MAENEGLVVTERAKKLPSVEITEGPALPSARGSHAGAALNGGVVVVASGSAWSADGKTKTYLADTLLFDDGVWRAGPSLPHPTVEAASASDGKHLYIVGGLTEFNKPSADGFVLTLDRGNKLQIDRLPTLPVRNAGGAAAVLGGRLYLVGGFADGKLTTDCWELDLSATERQWRRASPFPGEPRAYPALVAAREQLYLLGGVAAEGKAMQVFKDVYQYDPQHDAWKKCGELPAAGYCWGAVPIDRDERELLIGGRADGAIHDDLWILNLSDLSVRGIGRSVVTQSCAPLVRRDSSTFWLIGGEPDANKHRTERVTQIRLHD